MSEKSFLDDVALDFCYLSACTIRHMQPIFEKLAAELEDDWLADPKIKEELQLMANWWRSRLQHIDPSG